MSFIKIKTVSAAVIFLFSVTSCKKFIKEELVTTLTENYYKTDVGLEDLVRSAYDPLKWRFTGEQSYGMHNFGVDEFRAGDQFNNVHYNYYDANLNSNEPFVNGLWTNNYAGIKRCNMGIKFISEFSDASSALLGTAQKRNVRIAELKALRAFYYFQMVQQFGGVPLVTTYSAEPQSEFPRASVGAVYNQIISDFREAGPILDWRNSSERGRATRAMAYHFLAKTYLTRGSSIAEDRGKKTSDMDSVIVFADSVIRFGGHVLETDYGNLFSASYPDGQIPALGKDGTPPTSSKAKIVANNNSNEIIFAANFSDNLNLAGLNNTTHLYYPVQYDAGVGIPGMTRDFFNGRPFRRLRPTDYTIDIFDKVNDSRFFKTFQTVFYRNVTSNAGLLTFTAGNAPSPDLVGKPRVGLGDTSGLFIVNPINNPLLTSTIASMRYYAVYARYKQTAPSAAIVSDFSPNKYLTMVKFADPIRLTSSTASGGEQRGIRNGTYARLAETYLILAEAYGRKGDYVNALLHINTVRSRAAYKANEARSPQIWQYLGGSNALINTTATNQATLTLFTTNAASEMYPPSATSDASRFIHFMLNERTRELCGEFYRWEDLVRTETFFERTKLYNADVSAAFAQYHKLRPIPLVQIKLQTINGQPMTAQEVAAYQNQGY